VRKTKLYGRMSSESILLFEGSDPRNRQGEITVPGLSRSGRADKSCNGLPTTCAASVSGERAIAGVPLACTAGLSGPMTPARDSTRGEMPSWNRVEGESILRLKRGGGGGGLSDTDEDVSEGREPTIYKGEQTHTVKMTLKKVPRVMVDRNEVDARVRSQIIGVEEENKENERERD